MNNSEHKNVIPELQNIKPLSDDDILNETRALNSLSSDVMNKILEDYRNAIASMMTMMVENTKEEEQIVQLEQVKRVLGLCPDVEKFLRSKDKVWGVRKYILAKNADYFLNKDYSSLIKKDSKQAFIESLIELLKERYEEMDPRELAFYWEKASVLLNCVAQFKKAQLSLKKK